MKNIFRPKHAKSREHAPVTPVASMGIARPVQDDAKPDSATTPVAVQPPAGSENESHSAASDLNRTAQESASRTAAPESPGGAGGSGTPAAAAQIAGPVKTEPPGTGSEAAGAGAPRDGKTVEKAPQPQKSAMGDLSDLFAKATHEDTKASKLAEQMTDVNVDDLLKEGIGLVGRLKKR
jgi:hypothetical protein